MTGEQNKIVYIVGAPPSCCDCSKWRTAKGISLSLFILVSPFCELVICITVFPMLRGRLLAPITDTD